MSGLAVPGSLSLAQTSLDPMGDHDITANVSAQEFTADRDAATASQAYVYYIMADFDINGSITHEASGAAGADDSWSMSAIDIRSATATNPQLSLPSASGVSVPAGLITALDTDGSTAGTFAVSMSVDLSDQGALSATASISGADVTSSATAEDVLKAQVVQWQVNGAAAPSVDATTADQLTDVLQASELATQYSAELAAIEAAYTLNVVASWSIAISAIAQTTNNVLSKHARNLNKTDANVFAAGAKIVASDTAAFSVEIADYLGAAVAVASGTVYGVVQQS